MILPKATILTISLLLCSQLLAITPGTVLEPKMDKAAAESIKVKKLFQLSGEDFLECAPAAVGSVAYIATRRGKLHSVSLNTGQVKWSFDLKKRPTGKVVATNPTVFVSTIKGIAFAIDRLSGKLRWKHESGSQLYSPPGPVDPDGCECRGIFRKLTITTGDGETICFDSKSGEKIWQNDGEIRINAPVTQLDNQLLLADCDSRVRALSLTDGKQLWQINIDAPVGGSPALARIDDETKIVIVTAEGDLLCIDAESRKTDFKFAVSPGSVIEATPVIVGNLAIIGSDAMTVSAVDLKEGKLSWKFTTDESFSDKIIVTTLGIFAADDSGKLYLLDAKDGKKYWSYDAASEITGMASIKDGIIFTTTDGTLRICRWQS